MRWPNSSAHRVLVEHVPQGGLGVNEVVFNVETVDAVLHALEAGDVVFVVANDEGFPLGGRLVLRGQS